MLVGSALHSVDGMAVYTVIVLFSLSEQYWCGCFFPKSHTRIHTHTCTYACMHTCSMHMRIYVPTHAYYSSIIWDLYNL